MSHEHMSREQLEAQPYEVWVFDCPECGGQTMAGDIEPEGMETCADCEAEVMVSR